uniref:Uncharacterized protein n=1 Tax=Steinernema glaseri TaxID=37863 RepID=A0A1I8A1J9_9BILA
MKLRDSLVNMLGEFVGLNKSPDFKLSSSSAQFLSDAVAEETHRCRLNIFIGNDADYCGPVHSRTHSASGYSLVSRDPDCFRRMSEPAVHSGFRKTSCSSSSSQTCSDDRRGSSGSSTFFGSIAAYSNHLGPLTTRL